MTLEDIDIVHLETFQTLLNGIENMLAEYMSIKHSSLS